MAAPLYLYLGRSKLALLSESQSIGRDEGNDIIINDRTVSKFHARFLHEENRLFIVDLNSTRGSKINGKLVRGKAELKEGSTLVLGDVTLIVKKPFSPIIAGLSVFIFILAIILLLLPSENSKDQDPEIQGMKFINMRQYQLAREYLNSQPASTRVEALIDTVNMLEWAESIGPMVSPDLDLVKIQDLKAEAGEFMDRYPDHETIRYWVDAIRELEVDAIYLAEVNYLVSSGLYEDARGKISKISNQGTRASVIIHLHTSEAAALHQDGQLELALDAYILLDSLDKNIDYSKRILGLQSVLTQQQKLATKVEEQIFIRSLSSERMSVKNGEYTLIEAQIELPKSKVNKYQGQWRSNILKLSLKDLYSCRALLDRSIHVPDKDTIRYGIVRKSETKGRRSAVVVVDLLPKGNSIMLSSGKKHSKAALKTAQTKYGDGRTYQEQVGDREKALEYYLEALEVLDYDTSIVSGKLAYQRIQRFHRGIYF